MNVVPIDRWQMGGPYNPFFMSCGGYTENDMLKLVLTLIFVADNRGAVIFVNKKGDIFQEPCGYIVNTICLLQNWGLCPCLPPLSLPSWPCHIKLQNKIFAEQKKPNRPPVAALPEPFCQEKAHGNYWPIALLAL